MNDELPESIRRNISLEARFAERPHVLARLHDIAEMMDKAIEDGATADEAEQIAIEQLRHLGADILADYAMQKHSQSLQKAKEENPGAIKHIEKKHNLEKICGKLFRPPALCLCGEMDD